MQQAAHSTRITRFMPRSFCEEWNDLPATLGSRAILALASQRRDVLEVMRALRHFLNALRQSS
jgi:hypothetical protein